MRILPVQYQYANTQQYCYKSTTKPNQILSTKKQIYSQNISFGGLFDIFKKKESKTDITENIKNNLQMVEYKENILIKLWNKIKNIVKRK